MHNNIIQPEKSIAIGFGRKGSNRELVEEHLSELFSLAETAGANITESFYQELEYPNPATAIGSGKVIEIKEYIDLNEITLVIFDDDLSPTQLKNLETNFKIKVIDRSGLILDIFSKHAKSMEAKTQVELAQLQYLLPRLSRLWTHLSKQFGGIGTKGPGETQIETDRRIIKTKIQRLSEKLLQIEVSREQQRKGRDTLPRFALVGYTNSGKSTLMNQLTDSGVLVEDKLFATLDTTVRAFNLPNGKKALISDTVGFIRKLPTHLVASFRTTLAEASEADVLIHVVDISNPYYQEHIQTVNKTLESLKIKDKPVIVVLNKIDLVEDREEIKFVASQIENSVIISARKGININSFLDFLQNQLEKEISIIDFVLPYSESSRLPRIYETFEVLEREDGDDGFRFKIKVKPDKVDTFNYYFKNFLEVNGNDKRN